MPEGRASLSGRNAHAKWTVCQTCRLRIEYIPSFGATGVFRQAGPLAPDVEVAMSQVKEEVKTNPAAKEKLNAKAVSVIGAEESLKQRLQKLENERIKITTPKERPQANTNAPGAPAASQAIDLTDEQMKTAPGKKAAKRDNPKEAEQQEADAWSVLSEPASPPR